MKKTLIAAGGSLVLLLGACSADSTDFQKETEKFIEGDKVTDASGGIEFSDADCEKPANTDTGTTYTCTAIDSADSASYLFTVVITKKDAFELQSITPANGAPTDTPTDPATEETTPES